MLNLSIVIPLYNKAQSIKQTIECIQAQTYQNWEIVIVDGYSQDGSLEIAQEMAAADARIHIHMQENRRGVTPARNESVMHAQYEHIVFMDADDYWEDSYLERMVALIQDYPDCGIWGIAHGTMVGDKKVPDQRFVTPYRGILPESPWAEWGCPFWTSATAISKTAFEQVGGFDNRIIYGEDIDLWWRIMLNYRAALDSTEVLSYYRVDAENRACNHVFPLRLHIPYYIEKYQAYREENLDFRRFYDLQMLYRLYPYCFETQYRSDVKRITKQIDFSLQKKSMRIRFACPRLYRLYMYAKGYRAQKMDAYSGGC